MRSTLVQSGFRRREQEGIGFRQPSVRSQHSLSWLSTQSRPDLAVQTSLMSQQSFPRPSVFDLLQANQAVRRAKQQVDLKIRVPYIPLSELTMCFWSDAAFANSSELKTQGGWIIAFTSNRIKQGEDVPVFCFCWKSYKLPRVVSSTIHGGGGSSLFHSFRSL